MTITEGTVSSQTIAGEDNRQFTNFKIGISENNRANTMTLNSSRQLLSDVPMY